MASLGLNIKVDGLSKLQRRLQGLSSRVTDLRPIWGAIAGEFREGEREVFEKEGAVDGWGQWAPLDPKYAARKVKDGFPDIIMVRTGELEDSLTGFGPGSIFRSDPMSMEIGTSVEHAKYHQRAKSPRKRREPIRVTEEQMEIWGDIIERFIVESDDAGIS